MGTGKASLSSGIFTIPQAAALLGMKSTKLRSWVTGRRGAREKPLIKSDFAPIGHHIAISFVNLIEAKFIEFFVRNGVPAREIRRMAETAERLLNTGHPFATKAMFASDAAKIFLREQDRETTLYDLLGNNYCLYPIFRDALRKDLEFDASGIAGLWRPRSAEAPNIVVNPRVAFGAPTLAKSGVPVEALYNAYVAEDRDAATVAAWYEVPESEVLEAVKFHESLTVH